MRRSVLFPREQAWPLEWRVNDRDHTGPTNFAEEPEMSQTAPSTGLWQCPLLALSGHLAGVHQGTKILIVNCPLAR